MLIACKPHGIIAADFVPLGYKREQNCCAPTQQHVGDIGTDLAFGYIGTDLVTTQSFKFISVSEMSSRVSSKPTVGL